MNMMQNSNSSSASSMKEDPIRETIAFYDDPCDISTSSSSSFHSSTYPSLPLHNSVVEEEEEEETPISTPFVSYPMNNQYRGIKTKRRLQRYLSSSSYLHMFSSTSFTFIITITCIFSMIFLPFSTTNAIAFHNKQHMYNNNFSTIKMSTLVPSSTTSSKNALALLNTARLLREQKLSSSSSSSSSSYQYTDTTSHISKRRNEQYPTKQYSSSCTYHGLFDDDVTSSLSSAIKQQRQKEEEEIISNKVEKQLSSVKSLLQTSIGNDIPDIELLLQMEAARSRGKDGSNVAALAFMDLHHTGQNDFNDDSNDGHHNRLSRNGDTKKSSVSTIEKVAMSSLPSQLPGLASPVLSGRSRRSNDGRTQGAAKSKKNILSSSSSSSSTPMQASSTLAKTIHEAKSKPKKSDKTQTAATKTSFDNKNIKRIKTKQVSTIMTTRKKLSESTSTDRVSHDEEIQLARIIQRGAQLHSIKSKFEEKNMREITRQEWTELAKLESPKELRRLVSDYRKAKNKLVMANMGLVHAVVRTRMREFGKGSVSYEGISYEEMVQEGSLGLLRAAELFDPSRGLRFSTYATIWIKGILGNSSLSEAITLPLREKNKWNKIQTAIEEISAEKAIDDTSVHKPSEEEISARCGLKPDEVKAVLSKMKTAKNVLSLDYQYESRSRSGTDTHRFEALSNDKNLMDDVDLVEKLQLRADVVAALTRNLDAREARLMRLRYGLNDGKTRSISDCAEAMGISKARAQQLAAGCLKKLREADDAESLQEYLLSVA